MSPKYPNCSISSIYVSPFFLFIYHSPAAVISFLPQFHHLFFFPPYLISPQLSIHTYVFHCFFISLNIPGLSITYLLLPYFILSLCSPIPSSFLALYFFPSLSLEIFASFLILSFRFLTSTFSPPHLSPLLYFTFLFSYSFPLHIFHSITISNNFFFSL